MKPVVQLQAARERSVPDQIKVVENVLSANDEIASQNKELLNAQGILTLNIMASPGAGKTSIVMSTIRALQGRLRCGVIEGDVASSVDSEKVATLGVPVVQINTGGGCHLDARQIQDSLAALPLADIDLLMIENVGNLICPTAFFLGETLRIAIASVPEGDDKPLKYPTLFHQAQAVVLNKMDLMPYIDFSLSAFRQRIRGLNPNVHAFEVSCKTGEGIDAWTDWLADMHTALDKRATGA
jgi:hydrogenase nickel incorporation protein HypB